jgi:SP family general alpha glucoside:H+ symporter-like MFS transporter
MEPTQSKYAEEKELGHASLGDVDVSEKEVTEEARLATHKEHNLSVRQGLKAYRKAIGWSILMSSAVIMEGYDTILVSLCFICASWHGFGATCVE